MFITITKETLQFCCAGHNVTENHRSTFKTQQVKEQTTELCNNWRLRNRILESKHDKRLIRDCITIAFTPHIFFFKKKVAFPIVIIKKNRYFRA